MVVKCSSSSGNSKDVKSYRNQIENSLVISSGSMSDVRHVTCPKVHLPENFELPRCWIYLYCFLFNIGKKNIELKVYRRNSFSINSPVDAY